MNNLKPGDILTNGTYEFEVMYVSKNKERIATEDKDGGLESWDINFLIAIGYTKKEEPWVPVFDEIYYFPSLSEIDKYSFWNWQNEDYDLHRLAHGLVFKTKEEAIKRADEIIKLIRK